MFQFFLISVIALISISSGATQSDQSCRDVSSQFYHALVVQTVVNHYNRLRGDDNIQIPKEMTSNDVWDIERIESDEGCRSKLFTGLARPPQLEGSVMKRFWVCVSEVDAGELRGEFQDDDFVADE